jgi:hypothetical protein
MGAATRTAYARLAQISLRNAFKRTLSISLAIRPSAGAALAESNYSSTPPHVAGIPMWAQFQKDLCGASALFPAGHGTGPKAARASSQCATNLRRVGAATTTDRHAWVPRRLAIASARVTASAIYHSSKSSIRSTCLPTSRLATTSLDGKQPSSTPHPTPLPAPRSLHFLCSPLPIPFTFFVPRSFFVQALGLRRELPGVELVLRCYHHGQVSGAHTDLDS